MVYFVCVCGASGSGKTSVCRQVMEAFEGQSVALLALDSFYKTPTDAEKADIINYNFDHPNAFDFPLLVKALAELRNEGKTQVPRYSFETHNRLENVFDEIKDVEVVLFEGILALHDPAVRELMDLSIFVDTDLDMCLVRRIKRDMKFRARSLESILAQYERTVKPSYEIFIAPLKRYADIIIPRGGSNVKAIQMVCQHISEKLLSCSPRAGSVETAYKMPHFTPTV
eukprot:TRINITY_DN101_c0_g3_i1.p2 TRINITY_DN101_c0_g3~~TRINITY_DN101_c0_g3_i1.p2  ORF type:complete len:227 (+),score=114.23 TRINITY_DN101_c0_g3_i1:66-746(+)